MSDDARTAEENIEYHRTRMEYHRALVEAYEMIVNIEKKARGVVVSPPSKAEPGKEPRKRSSGSVGAMVESLLERVGPLTITEMTAKLLEQGWATTSENPSNNVRTQVGRQVAAGRLVKGTDGRYRLADTAG